MHNPVHIIDEYAAKITRSLDIVVYSLEGLYEKTARDNPTNRGLGEFWLMSNAIIANGLTTAMNELTEAADALYASLSDSERAHYEAQHDSVFDHGVAYESFGALFTQAKLTYAKRLREVISARAFGIDTYNPNPKIMTRAGHQWNFSDYAYLNSRQLLVDWYNNAKIEYLSAIGAEEFGLFTNDPELMYTSYKVADYPEIAAKLFHPRTTKLVGDEYVAP